MHQLRRCTECMCLMKKIITKLGYIAQNTTREMPLQRKTNRFGPQLQVTPTPCSISNPSIRRSSHTARRPFCDRFWTGRIGCCVRNRFSRPSSGLVWSPIQVSTASRTTREVVMIVVIVSCAQQVFRPALERLLERCHKR
jgi:hypothetical protein